MTLQHRNVTSRGSVVLDSFLANQLRPNHLFIFSCWRSAFLIGLLRKNSHVTKSCFNAIPVCSYGYSLLSCHRSVIIFGNPTLLCVLFLKNAVIQVSCFCTVLDRRSKPTRIKFLVRQIPWYFHFPLFLCPLILTTGAWLRFAFTSLLRCQLFLLNRLRRQAVLLSNSEAAARFLVCNLRCDNLPHSIILAR